MIEHHRLSGPPSSAQKLHKKAKERVTHKTRTFTYQLRNTVGGSKKTSDTHQHTMSRIGTIRTLKFSQLFVSSCPAHITTIICKQLKLKQAKTEQNIHGSTLWLHVQDSVEGLVQVCAGK